MELGLALMVEWRELIVALTVPRPKLDKRHWGSNVPLNHGNLRVPPPYATLPRNGLIKGLLATIP